MSHMLRVVSLLSAAGIMLNGCATTSFAPPSVAIHHPVTQATTGSCTGGKNRPGSKSVETKNTTIITTDREKRGDKTIDRKKETTETQGPDPVTIPQNVDGAFSLIDNFYIAYRCAADDAADGRQIFQIPAFLLTAAAATGVAFGLNENQILGLGVGATTFKAGGAYLAPQKKAALINRAIDAVTCIRSESAGATFFDIGAAPAGVSRLNIQSAAGGTVSISPVRKYFEIVASALMSVQSILAGRLSDVGSQDFTSVVEEIKGLIPKTQSTPAQAATTKAALAGAASKLPEAITIDLDAMQARLQICVLRAKL